MVLGLVGGKKLKFIYSVFPNFSHVFEIFFDKMSENAF